MKRAKQQGSLDHVMSANAPSKDDRGGEVET
jgi:hypothetical protein